MPSLMTASAVLLCSCVAAVQGAGISLSREAEADSQVNSDGRFHVKRVPVDMTLTFTYNGIRAWHPSLSGTMQNFPAHYLGDFQIATPNNYQFPQDGVVEYDCPPADAGVGPCDVVVFLYECFPCKSLKGGLPAHLMSNGYKRSRCAPTFTVKPGGSQQRMSAYIKTIPAGANEIIYMPKAGKVEFVAFGLSRGGGRDCPTYNAEAPCVGSDGHCVWNPLIGGDKCTLATCVQKGPGGCDLKTCANAEI